MPRGSTRGDDTPLTNDEIYILRGNAAVGFLSRMFGDDGGYDEDYDDDEGDGYDDEPEPRGRSRRSDSRDEPRGRSRRRDDHTDNDHSDDPAPRSRSRFFR